MTKIGEVEFFEIDESGTHSKVADKANDKSNEELPSFTIGDEDVEIIPFSTVAAKPKASQSKDKDDDGNTEEDGDDNNGDDNANDDEGTDNEESNTGEEAPLDDDSSSSQYLAFAKMLFDGGVLTQFDDKEFIDLMKKEGQVKALIELNKRTINDVIAAQFAKLPDDYKRLFDAASKGIPLKDAWEIQTSSSNVSKLTDTDLEDVEIAKQVITEMLKQRNFTDGEIKEFIEEAISLDKLTDKAKSAKKFILDNASKREADEATKAKKRADDIAAEEAAKLERINGMVNDFTKLVPNVNLNNKQKTRIIDLLTKPTKQLDNGTLITGVWAKRLENPEKFDTILAYMIDNGIFDGKLGSLKSAVVSDAAKDFMATMEKSDVSSKGSPRRVGIKQTKKDAVNALNMFRIKREDSY